MKVTIFKNVFDKTQPHYLDLHKALERIQSGRSSGIVDKVRGGNKEKKLESCLSFASAESLLRAQTMPCLSTLDSLCLTSTTSMWTQPRRLWERTTSSTHVGHPPAEMV